jgi:hypothetical protein
MAPTCRSPSTSSRQSLPTTPSREPGTRSSCGRDSCREGPGHRSRGDADHCSIGRQVLRVVWAQVTRPGTTPWGTPSGESVDPNKEERMLLAAAIERAKCRRVIFICGYSFSINHVFRGAIDRLKTRVCRPAKILKSGTTLAVRPRGTVGDARQVPIVIGTNDRDFVPSNSSTAPIQRAVLRK